MTKRFKGKACAHCATEGSSQRAIMCSRASSSRSTGGRTCQRWRPASAATRRDRSLNTIWRTSSHSAEIWMRRAASWTTSYLAGCRRTPPEQVPWDLVS